MAEGSQVRGLGPDGSYRLVQALGLLCALLLVNAAPMALARLLGERCAWPLDAGMRLGDGRRLFGAHKTLRGVLAAIAVGGAWTALLQLGWLQGVVLGLGAMLGDLLSSFVKRRLALAPGTGRPVLDQLPEALVPLLLLRLLEPLAWGTVLAVTLAFVLGGLVLSRLLYALSVRPEPW